MKTNRLNPTREQGSVMIFALTVMSVSAILMGSYLMLVQSQSASVSRSQSWNAAIAITEAGLEDGMALINKGAHNIITDPWAWTNNLTTDGWTTFGSSGTTRTVTINGATYTATVTISPGLTPTVTATGTAPYTSLPWVFGTNGYAMIPFPQPFVAQIGASQPQTSSSGNVTLGRTVQVQTVKIPLFPVSVLTRLFFDMKGNNTTVDSFDSSNPLYSTNGQYSVALRRYNGDVATDSGLVNSLHLGNGNIYGHVYTGPGTAQSAVQVGAQGGVGDAAWQAANPGAIEPGYWLGDFNVAIPDVPTPTFVGSALPAASNGVITLNGGVYTTTSSLSTPLVVTGQTILWVQNSFSSGVTISNTNSASLVLYVGTTNASGNNSISVGGNGALNSPGYAKNLQIYGLPSLTGISFSGNAAFAGTIYAPEAALTGGGGGNNTIDTSGAIVVNSVTLNGKWNFHYDENLKINGPIRGWIANSWAEQKYTTSTSNQ